MSHLRRGVDELEVDLFQRGALGVHQQRLAQGDDTALGTDAAALDHQEVLVDLTVEGETSHRGDRLVRQIVLGGGAVLDDLGVDEKVMISSKVRSVDLVLGSFWGDQSYHYVHMTFHRDVVNCRLMSATKDFIIRTNWENSDVGVVLRTLPSLVWIPAPMR